MFSFDNLLIYRCHDMLCFIGYWLIFLPYKNDSRNRNRGGRDGGAVGWWVGGEVAYLVVVYRFM